MKLIKKHSQVKLKHDISLNNGLVLYKGDKFCVVKKDRKGMCTLVSGTFGDGWSTGFTVNVGVDSLELQVS